GIGASFASVDTPSLVLDTIKRADAGDGIVLRLYEAYGGRGTARVRLREPFTRARLGNALEEPFADVETDGWELVLPFRPHQVLTVIVER
ncbi:MAG TPA: glycosyl hydrolase-related protein, partial [Gaiellaceae bacterium]|nr:glycosyl hydrolase-related protein [Gaiellaceae bacterium]